MVDGLNAKGRDGRMTWKKCVICKIKLVSSKDVEYIRELNGFMCTTHYDDYKKHCVKFIRKYDIQCDYCKVEFEQGETYSIYRTTIYHSWCHIKHLEELKQ